ncbi:MAG: alpha/beta hydrolase [Chitinophagaceae bacterium]|nr:alpha/beta hydrolase [Chitinophagaceae bacterium]
MRSLLLTAIVSIFFLSCKKNVVNDFPQPASLPEKTEMNVPYGSDGAQKMDIYLPAGRTMANTKVMILIHGGGWSQGDKSELTPYVDTLKKRMPGWAIFNINYRLATGSANFFPAQENDVKAAIDFIYGKRTDYVISDKYVLVGTSAGGHLALLHAYKNTTPVKIKAVVDFFGPTDMADMYNNPPNPLVGLLMIQVTGGIPATHPTIYSQATPLNYITAQTPPTIILHGGVDIVVSFNQSVALKNKLTTFGVVNQYVFYPTENHGWVGANLTDSFDKITAFLNANVN